MKYLSLLSLAFFSVACSPTLDKNVRSEIGAIESQIARQSTAKPSVYLEEQGDSGSFFGEPVDLIDAVAHMPVLDHLFRYSQGSQDTLTTAADYLSKSAHVAIDVSADAVKRSQEVIPKNTDSVVAGGFPFEASGRLRDILDNLTSATGTFWKATDNRISIFYIDSESFEIELQVSELSWNNQITNASSTMGSSQVGSGGSQGGAQVNAGGVSVAGSSKQDSQSQYRSKIYDDIKQTIPAMLTKDVGSFAISPSTNSLLVRDTPAVLSLVRAYVADINSRLNKQVEIEVTILAVEDNDSNSAGLSLDLVRNTLTNRFNFSFAGASGSSGSGQAFEISRSNNTNSPWAGSAAVIDALRQNLHASVMRNLTLTTYHNQMTRLQSVSEKTFVVGNSTVIVPDSNLAQTSTQLLTQSNGISISIVPMILANGMVSLDIQGSISSPREPTRVVVDGTQLELPNRDLEDFSHRRKIRSGDVLLLAGIEASDAAFSERGTGSAKFFLLGGGKKSSTARRNLVILIAPKIV